MGLPKLLYTDTLPKAMPLPTDPPAMLSATRGMVVTALGPPHTSHEDTEYGYTPLGPGRAQRVPLLHQLSAVCMDGEKGVHGCSIERLDTTAGGRCCRKVRDSVHPASRYFLKKAALWLKPTSQAPS